LVPASFDLFVFLIVVGCTGLLGVIPTILTSTSSANLNNHRGIRQITIAAIQAEHGSLPDYQASSDKIVPTPQLIVWPEEALPFDISQSKRDWPRLQRWVKDKNIVLVTGTQQAGDGALWRNTALTMDASGELGRHYKIHTVHLFNDGTPGTEAKPIQTQLGKIGTPVCFDCDYEDVVRKMTAAGAEVFAVPMMDPMEWGLTQRRMHSELFRIRAAENGRAMAVCATSGVTQLIGTRGQLLWTNEGEKSRPCILEPMKPGVLTGSLALSSELTFYTRFGWLFPWCALVVGAGIIGACCIRNERQT
jgi:apolipoprotein N-acyltransferase